MNKKGILMLFITGAIFTVISFLVTITLLKNEINKMPAPFVASGKEQIKDYPVATPIEKSIKPYTKIVYEYYYPEDGITKKEEDIPPYYLLDLNMEELKAMYEDWTILSFSDDEVVMRRNMDGKSGERYILGQKDGYITVFYEEAQNGISIRELTDTPIMSLPKEEQERLENGISVLGNDNLEKILADYGS